MFLNAKAAPESNFSASPVLIMTTARKTLKLNIFLLLALFFLSAAPWAAAASLKAPAAETSEVSAASGSRATAEDELRDIKRTMDYEFVKTGNSRQWLFAAAALLLALLYLFLRPKKAGEDLRPPLPPPVPPEKTALEALRALEDSPLLKEGAYKKFYMELSHIIRAYTGDYLKFNCVDLYNDEILAEMKKRGVAARHAASFDAITSECDLVKFARFLPDASDAAAALRSAFDFVRITSGADFK